MFYIHLFYSNKRLPLLLVGFVIIISMLWTYQEPESQNGICVNCVEPDIGADNPKPVTDIIVNGIVNLSSEETIAEQVDDFMSSVTPIEPESE
jgi:hypothetical protein